MTMQTANRLLRHLGTAVCLAAFAWVVLHPQWEIVLTGGQVARPSAWLWNGPDTSLLSVASSRIDTLAVVRQAALALSGAGIYWWLGGLRRGAANSAAEARPVASLR